MDINIIGSWFINNNRRVREDVERNTYKRLITLIAYGELESIRTRGSKLFENRIFRDGIVISISDFIPNPGLDYGSIDGEELRILEAINLRYGDMDGAQIDEIHRSLLDEFIDGGGLKQA